MTNSNPQTCGASSTSDDTTKNQLLLNSRIMHDIFINACPSLKTVSAENIRIISKLIHAYFFGKSAILGLIKGILNEEIIIETIQGIDIIIQEENIENIQEIEDHITDISRESEICSPITT